jgi:hypothetical protein
LLGGCFQKDFARHVFPTRVGVREKMANVFLAQRAQHGVADGVHEGVGVGMAVETFRVGNFHAAEKKFPASDQLVNVVSDAYMNHAHSLAAARTIAKQFHAPAHGSAVMR